MATSLAQLLDALVDTARNSDDNADARADAGAALGQLGRALAQLRRDGVSPIAGDVREKQVAALAACTEVAIRTPSTESTLTPLAAAAADTVAVLYEHTTVASRWAAATAVAEAVTPLAELIGASLPAGPAAQWLAEVERHSVLVQQMAALHPPTRADAAVLDRPVAGPAVLTSTDPVLVVPDAVAVLLHTTARAAEHPSVVEVLAYTIGAQALSSAAQHLGQADPPPAAQATAADAWRAVRAALRPYEDGSRRPHSYPPPGVAAAGRLHAVLASAGPDPASWTTPLRAAVVSAAQHLPALAGQLLYGAVRSWADTGALIAYARDLPPREERVAAFLRGYSPGGLVRVHAADLRPVVGALHNARLLSLAVADQAAHPGARAVTGFPQRAWAANRELLDHPQTPVALDVAVRETYRRLQAARVQRPGPGRAR